MTRTVAILGNVGPGTYPYTTENEYLAAYEANDITVEPFQEQSPSDWLRLIDRITDGPPLDLVQWTSTPSYRHEVGNAVMWELIATCRRKSVPIIGVHLDKFFDIPERLGWLKNDPYFKGVDVMFTADGGDHPWESYGINHRWLLPAVSERWCKKGNESRDFRCDVAFVGSWQGHYHQNSKHRHRLIRHLQSRGATMFPLQGKEAIRGQALTDLYWSAKVVVGDSFFAGPKPTQPPPRYGSDRTPETLGRGGVLLHTEIEGWNDPGGPFDLDASYTYKAWDWQGLDDKIEEILSKPAQTMTRKRNATIKQIKENHSYEVRVQQIFALLAAEGLL